MVDIWTVNDFLLPHRPVVHFEIDISPQGIRSIYCFALSAKQAVPAVEAIKTYHRDVTFDQLPVARSRGMRREYEVFAYLGFRLVDAQRWRESPTMHNSSALSFRMRMVKSEKTLVLETCRSLEHEAADAPWISISRKMVYLHLSAVHVQNRNKYLTGTVIRPSIGTQRPVDCAL